MTQVLCDLKRKMRLSNTDLALHNLFLFNTALSPPTTACPSPLSSPPQFPCVAFTHIVSSDVLSPNPPATQHPNEHHRACVRPHAHRLRPMLQMVLQHLVCAIRTSATTEASFPDRLAISSDAESASCFQSAPFHSD